jgi:DNA-binding transcriptional regulator YiaG
VTGKDVKRIRESLGLSQREFAERLGVHTITVAKWEAGMQGMRGPAERLISLLGGSAGAPKKTRQVGQRKRSKTRASRARR